jgi:bifunctional non-homologous end joining protein LigD
MHVNVRIEPRWTFAEVRRAAVALSRAVERRTPALASSKRWKEERHGVFLDYTQNAKDRTTCSGYSVRPLPDARVSAPLHWHEVPNCDPADFTIPSALRKIGNPHAGMDAEPGSLEKLLELADKDEAAGLGDAPWPPHFHKVEAEGPRVAPSRARIKRKKATSETAAYRCCELSRQNSRTGGSGKMEEQTHRDSRFLAPDDVPVDSMRGSSSTWTRIRVNLRHVPEAQRPLQETPDPDDDPTREWRQWRKKKAAKNDG